MRSIAIPSTAALLCAFLPAQADHFTSSPNGFTSTEGGSSNGLIGSAAALRFQQVDATNFGSKADRDRWAFRRDGLAPDNPQYGARNVELELVLAESDLETLTTTFDANYVPGTNTVVFARKSVAFPDWTTAPATTPANHDLVIMLDMLWTYEGKAVTGTDLLWEVRVFSNDQAGNPYPMDADPAIPAYLPGVSAALSSATCTAAGQTAPYDESLTVLNFGTKMQLDIQVSNAAANSPAAYLLGIPQVTPLQPTFCGDLQVQPLFTIALGNTNGSGVAGVSFDAPYSPASIGASFAGQAIVADGSQPNGLAFGPGQATSVPMDPPATPQCKHLHAPDPNATTATSAIVDGGIIAMTNHP